MFEFFKASDFEDFSNGSYPFGMNQKEKEDIAYFANLRLQKEIKTCPVVYGWEASTYWRPHRHECDKATHKARLVFIEELPKDPCPHVPAEQSLLAEPRCILCGVALELEWKEKK